MSTYRDAGLSSSVSSGESEIDPISNDDAADGEQMDLSWYSSHILRLYV